MDWIVLAGGAFVGGGVVGLGATAVALIRRLGRLEAELARMRSAPPMPAPAAVGRDGLLDAASAVRLLEIGVGDSLDALVRISPEAARRAISRAAPHLIEK